MLGINIDKYPKSLQLSIVEGIFGSIMTGGAMAFIVAFAVFLKASSIEIAYLIAFPALFSAIFQLSSIKILNYYGERKKIIVTTIILQAISWLLIAAIPFIFPQNQVMWLIIFTTLGTTIASLGQPLWQSLMRSLTPEKVIGEYFGVRNAIIGLVAFITTITCGAFLQLIQPSFTLYAFLGIFLISFIGRLFSGLILRRINEPKLSVQVDEPNIIDFIKQLGSNNFGRFIIFGTLMSFTLAMIGPFFSFYLLKNLGLQTNYLLYTTIIATAMLSSIISLPYWGKILDRFGAIKTLKATMLLLALYPLIIIFIRDPYLLIIIEVFDGIVGAGFTLGLASFIYESFDSKKIVKYAAYQSTLFGIAIFFGTLVSGYMLLFDVSWPILTNTFYIVCALVTALRIGIYAISIHQIKSIKPVREKIRSQKLVISALTLQPITEPLLTRFMPIISTAENTTINEVREIERATVKELTLAEKTAIKKLKQIEELAEKEIKEIKTIGRKRVNKIKRTMKKNKIRGFLHN